jgi:hypothetical protein
MLGRKWERIKTNVKYWQIRKKDIYVRGNDLD